MHTWDARARRLPGSAAAGAARRPHVLAIEDDPQTQGLLRDTLAGEVEAFAALDSALGAAELVRQLRPDVILLDLGLPYRSGGALLQELKADPTIAPTPVIVVSALTELLGPQERALAAAVLPKPFSPDELIGAVHAAYRPPS